MGDEGGGGGRGEVVVVAKNFETCVLAEGLVVLSALLGSKDRKRAKHWVDSGV